MKNTKDNLFINRLKSIGYAFAGMFYLFKNEASIKIQLCISLLMAGLGFYYNISYTEWCIQLFACGLVMSIEGINTAIEKIADFVHPEHDIKIGIIKDIAAGAVLIASIVTVIIGAIIYIPKF